MIGVSNGDPNCQEWDKKRERSLFNGIAQVIVQPTRRPGTLVLEATSRRLEQATLTLTANEATLRPAIADTQALEADLRTSIALVLFAISWTASATLYASTFYVDALRGNDFNPGTSPTAPWKSLDKVNGSRYHAGDRILFHSGSRWAGQLVLSSSGAEGAPILIDRYGKGKLPRIDGKGRVENVLQLENVEEIEVHHLEITNHGAQPGVRRGVLIASINFGTAHHLVVSDLYIHDVNGTNERKETGGILFRTIGDERPSNFDGLSILRNILWKVDRSAIAGQSSEALRSRWHPSLHVIIRDNYAEDIGGDGIVPWATDGALIEHNIVMHCNQRAGSYNAGIWPWSTDNSLFQLNEAAYTHSTLDGEGFDSDYNSRNSHFLYNFSHDNDGGFMLICTPVKRNPLENVGNSGTLIQHNISWNDHARIFNLSGADRTNVQSNAIYIAPGDDVEVLLTSNWDGWSTDAVFRDNTFDVAGTARFGHELQRKPDGTYEIGPGWGGAKDIRFAGNRYFGRFADMPVDSTGAVDSQFHGMALDWREPLFDPGRPDTFSTYLRKHRTWMVRLFVRQFGGSIQLGTAEPLAVPRAEK